MSTICERDICTPAFNIRMSIMFIVLKIYNIMEQIASYEIHSDFGYVVM